METPSKIQEEVKKQIDLSMVEELLKSNSNEFESNGIKYRLRKPTFKERQELYQARLKKYTELLKNETYLLEDDLKKVYLQRGIDLDQFIKDINSLEEKKQKVYLKLGEAVKQSAPVEELELFRKEIEDFTNEQQLLSIQRQQYLEFSIENQVMLYVYYHAVSLVAEKFLDEKWVRVFASYAELESFDNQDLLSQFFMRIPLLFRHELEVS